MFNEIVCVCVCIRMMITMLLMLLMLLLLLSLVATKRMMKRLLLTQISSRTWRHSNRYGHRRERLLRYPEYRNLHSHAPLNRFPQSSRNLGESGLLLPLKNRKTAIRPCMFAVYLSHSRPHCPQMNPAIPEVSYILSSTPPMWNHQRRYPKMLLWIVKKLVFLQEFGISPM